MSHKMGNFSATRLTSNVNFATHGTMRKILALFFFMFATQTLALDAIGVNGCGLTKNSRDPISGAKLQVDWNTGVLCTSATGGGGGGGGGATGSVTSAGVNGTVAQAIQGINGGIPVAVSWTGQQVNANLYIAGNPNASNNPAFAQVTNFPATQAISAASLPLPTGAATSAKQPALGTAGTAATDVITVQGISGGTSLPVTVGNFPTTQAVNNTQVGGVAIATGTGTANTGTQRVAVSSDSFPATQAVTFTGQSVSVSNFPTTQNVNTSQVGGVTVATGTGLANTGTQRVAVSSDSFPATQPVSQVSGPWTENQTQVNGVALATGTGTANTGTQRVAVSSDSFPATQAVTWTGQTVALTAGSAIIGKVGIDQTTPGTTNGVQVNAALPAGTNIIGNVRIDQTTPGTTNGVQVNAALPTGGNTIGAVTQASGPWTTNNTQINGVAVATGSGATNTGTQRVILSTDSPQGAPLVVNPTAGSGTVTSGGTFQSIFSSSTTRKQCHIQNKATTPLYVFSGAIGSATRAASYELAGTTVVGNGGQFDCSTAAGTVDGNQISVDGTTAGAFSYSSQ